MTYILTTLICVINEQQTPYTQKWLFPEEESRGY
jgi:hypothetical protein